MALVGVTGKEAAIAFAKFGTNSWGVPASVTKGMLFTNDGGLTYAPTYVDDNAFGQDFLGPAEPGDVAAPDLTWTTRDRFDGNEYILQALAMGSPSAPTISTSAAAQTTSWKHVIDLAASIDGLGITAAMDKVLYVEELTSAKVYGFGMAVGDAGIMDISFKVLGSKTTIISSINTRSTVNLATYPTLLNRVFRQHGNLRMNLNAAGSLVAADSRKIEQCSFEFTRPQDAPFVFNQNFADEPGDNGYPEFTLNVTFPRMNTYSANSLRTAIEAGRVFKADWTFKGAYINSTDQYTEMYEFPYLEIHEFASSFEGANQVKPTATFKAKYAQTSPTGMPFINPFRLTRISTSSVQAF